MFNTECSMKKTLALFCGSLISNNYCATTKKIKRFPGKLKLALHIHLNYNLRICENNQAFPLNIEN